MDKKLERYISTLELKIQTMQRQQKNDVGEIARIKSQVEIDTYMAVISDLKRILS